MFESAIIKEMRERNVKITSDCDFFTRRENVVIVKYKNENFSRVEYFCEKCKFKNLIKMKIKNFKKIIFSCENCGKKFEILPLKKSVGKG